jgi:hypothetical protein
MAQKKHKERYYDKDERSSSGDPVGCGFGQPNVSTQ